MTRIIGIIPAQNAYTHLQVKALTDMGKISIIHQVYEQARKAKLLSRVIVATDHDDIFRHIRSIGGEVCMTNKDHLTSTEHCAEALASQYDNFDFVIKIQGNDPFITPEQIDLLASALAGDTEIATLIKRIKEQDHLLSPDVVKVVVSKTNRALYFSRSPIPYVRNTSNELLLNHALFYRHIEIWAFRSDILERLTQLPTSVLEKAESLEQLRWIENGFRINVIETEQETIGTDIPVDLHKAYNSLNN